MFIYFKYHISFNIYIYNLFFIINLNYRRIGFGWTFRWTWLHF